MAALFLPAVDKPGGALAAAPLAVQIKKKIIMSKGLVAALFISAMIAVIVIVDLLFFRHYFWERLILNIGIVLVFIAFYFRFINHP